jgi:hypothetical protein
MENALIWNQPPSLQRIFCEGPAPSPIEQIIPRAEIEVPDWYAAWATDFALLSDEYIAHVAKGAPTGGWHWMFQRGWKPTSASDQFTNCYYLDVSHGRLWVDYLHPGGWNIELNHPCDVHPDPRILTSVRGNMPVLCSSLPTAVQLAEVCFPSPHYHVYWEDYWRRCESEKMVSTARRPSRKLKREGASFLRR